ncbi:YtxH domain-containing protein [uncultured Metabacillus sp.]|uniref:YtxH domain-containing protein n=1 Tax=Metabacillus sp. Hm71 TaxID=3450743 RepID=UPI0026179AC9|nr:YtxH domain-containing protein [uncultured Metabacillus sp.]
MAKNNKDFLMGSLIGGLVGAAAALFLAPKSGKEIRENLGQQANVMRDRTGKFTSQTLEKGTGLANVAKEKTASLSQVVTEQSSQIMNKVRDITSASKGQSDVVQKEVAEALEQVSDGASTPQEDRKKNDEGISAAIAEAVDAIEQDENKDQSEEEVKTTIRDEVKTNL